MKNGKPKARNDFVRATITIPAELASHVEKRKNEPTHAGNLSSYVRTLIIADQMQPEKVAA